MPTPSSVSTEGLVKKTLADRLHAQIMKGALPPGARIIEGKWAQQFGVAQGTIREAINILEKDGFVTKESGRSARVVNLTEKDVVELYQMRNAVEGLAANLAAYAQPDFSHLRSKVGLAMRKAAKAKSPGGMLDYDLQFHLELCRLSGNKHLFEYAQENAHSIFCIRPVANDGGRARYVCLGQRPRITSADRRSSTGWRSETLPSNTSRKQWFVLPRPHTTTGLPMKRA